VRALASYEQGAVRAAAARRVRGYVVRPDLIVHLCEGKRVLDLGVVGETCAAPAARIDAFPSSLHLRLCEAASSLVGIDRAARELQSLRLKHPELELYEADIESMADVLHRERPFDVIVAGDVLEHLSNPGRALEQMKLLLADSGTVVVTCPNSLGGPNYLRFLLGRFREGDDHVQSYNKHTLANLLRRHGFVASQIWTGIDRRPATALRRLVYGVASTVLRLFPDLGGTLIVVAEPGAPRAAQASGPPGAGFA